MTAARPPAFFASLASPTDLWSALDLDPASDAIAAVLDASYATTPTKAQRRTWRSLVATPWPTKRPRRVVCCFGRRSTKTTNVVAWSAVYELLCGDHDRHALPGSRIYAVIVCPRLAHAREAVRGCKAALEACAPLGVRFETRDLAGVPELVITSPRTACEKVITVFVADSVSVRSHAVCFAALDEAGFLPSDDWLAERDVDIVRALSPSMLQFPRARTLYTSSPGKPGSLFHSLVTKPPRDALCVSGPTWIFNERISEADCRREAGGDEELFEREYAARRWGAAGEAFMSSSAVWRCLGSKHAGGRGAQPGGAYVLALDLAQLRDQTAIVVCSSFETDVGPMVAPVRHVRVELAEVIESSKTDPVPVEVVAARVRDLSRAFNGAPVVFDPFQGPTVKQALAKLGMREHVDPTGDAIPRRGTFAQRSMAATAQTPRWRALRNLVDGGRLHMCPDDEPLARQLVDLKATQLSSGALKVEGRRDDLADALCLAAEIATRLPPTGGPDGAVEQVIDSIGWDREGGGLSVRSRFVRRHANGATELAEMPRWHPDFEAWAGEMISQGLRTPSIVAWEREKEQTRAFEVRVLDNE